MKKSVSKFLLLTLLIGALSGVSFANEEKVESLDKRTSLGLTPSEEAEFLSEMRQMLSSAELPIEDLQLVATLDAGENRLVIHFKGKRTGSQWELESTSRQPLRFFWPVLG